MSAASRSVARGQNYSIDQERTLLRVRVWRRPDLDTTAGANEATAMADQIRSLLDAGTKSIVFDLREAPVVAGPRTTAVLTDLLRATARAGAKIATLVSDDPVQLLQTRRIASTVAPESARIFTSSADAERWLAGR